MRLSIHETFMSPTKPQQSNKQFSRDARALSMAIYLPPPPPRSSPLPLSSPPSTPAPSSVQTSSKSPCLLVFPWKRFDYILSHLLPKGPASKQLVCGCCLGSSQELKELVGTSFHPPPLPLPTSLVSHHRCPSISLPSAQNPSFQQ